MLSSFNNLIFQSIPCQPNEKYFESFNRLLLADDVLLKYSTYQTQYDLNCSLLKNKYKTIIKPNISYCEFRNYIDSSLENRKINFNGMVYCFLCALAFYEVNTKKHHDDLTKEDWIKFAVLMSPCTVEKISTLYDEIFKKSRCFKKWTIEEDVLLKKIIRGNTKQKLPWKKITLIFNNLNYPQKKKSYCQCKERWKYVLRRQLKKGEWSKEEDYEILSFVMENGSKWSKLSQIFQDRTDHDIKNRFFSILSKYLHMPILKIKQYIIYLQPENLNEVRESIKMAYE